GWAREDEGRQTRLGWCQAWGALLMRKTDSLLCRAGDAGTICPARRPKATRARLSHPTVRAAKRKKTPAQTPGFPGKAPENLELVVHTDQHGAAILLVF